MSERNQPVVTIVTVNLNNGTGLARTIASIDAQTYGSWEHVIQDGGSTDETDAVIEGAQDARRKVVSQRDGGIYQGMNLGLARATGQLVWFLNSGDELSGPGVLQLIVDSWLREGWRWAYGSVTMTGATPEATYTYRRASIARKRVLLGIETYPHPSCIYELSLLREIGGYRPEFGPPADQELCLRAERLATPQFIDEILSIFEPGGSAGGYTPRKYEALFREIRRDSGELSGGNSVIDFLGVQFRMAYRNASKLANLMKRS